MDEPAGGSRLSQLCFLESLLECIPVPGFVADESYVLGMNGSFSREYPGTDPEKLCDLLRDLCGVEVLPYDLTTALQTSGSHTACTTSAENGTLETIVRMSRIDFADSSHPFVVGVVSEGPEDPREEFFRGVRGLASRWDFDVVSVFGHDGTELYDSPALGRTLGLEDEVGTLVGRVHEEDSGKLRFWVSSATAGHPVQPECSYRVLDSRGCYRWFSSKVETYGRVLGGGCVVRTREVPGSLGETGTGQPDYGFQPFVHNSSEVIKVCDPDGTLRYTSPSIKRVFGYEPDDVIGKNVLDFVHPDDLPEVVRKTGEALREGGVARNVAEYRHMHADGSWRHVESSGVYLLDDPDVRGVLVNCRDITDRREAEIRLAEAQKRFRNLVEHVPGIIYIEDVETAQTLYDSPGIEKLLGYPRDIFESDPDYWWKIIHPDDHEATLAMVRQPCEDGVVQVEYRVFASDGRIVWLRDEAVVIPSDDGGSGLRHGFIFDITQRKLAEQSLSEAEQRYRTLVEEVPVISYINRQRVGECSRSEYISPQIHTVLGYTQKEYLCIPDFWQSILHPDDRERIIESDLSSSELSEEFREDFRMLSRDGRVVWMRESGRMVRVEDDGEQVWQGVMLDITNLKETEADLRKTRERYRSLVENVPGIIYVRDYETGASIYDSLQISDILGYPPDIGETNPRYWWDIIHPDDIHVVQSASTEAERERLEYRVLASDGRVVWLRDSAVLLRDEKGFPVCWQGMLLDISEQKAAEASRAESEERVRRSAWQMSLLHSVRTAVQREIEVDKVLHTAVEVIASTYGYTQVSAYLVEDDRLVMQHQVGYDDVITNLPIRRGIMGKTAREGQPILVEDVHASDEFVGAIEGIVSEVCVPLSGENGEVMGVLNLESTHGMVLDEQDLRVAVVLGEHIGLAVNRARMHNQLRETERKYRMLVEQIPAVTYVQALDHEHTVTYVSPQVQDMLGYEPSEFYSDESLWYTVLHPDDRGRVLAEDNRTDLTGEPFAMEYRMVTRDGREVWVRDEATLLHDSEGNPQFWHGVLYDITEARRFNDALRQSEERFRSLVQNASDVIIILDSEHRTSYLTPSFEKVQGFPLDEIIGRNAFENVHRDDVGYLQVEFARLLADPDYEPVVDFRLRHRDGSWIHMEAVGRNLLDEPAVGGIVVNARDITVRKRTEVALRESEARLNSVTSGAPIIFFATDLEGTITLAKGKGLEKLGLSESDAVGKSVFGDFSGLPDVVDGVGRALRGEDVSKVVEIGPFTFDARYSPVYDELSGVSGVVGVATDMTDRRKLEMELEYRAFHDPLTGLANRTLCMDRISHALDLKRRDDSPVSLLFMDLDDFKVVNDSLGHDTGDRLLVEAAERLKECLRPGDTLARLGGDEFVIVLEDTDSLSATLVAARVAAALEAPFLLGRKDHEWFVTFSIGITTCVSNETTAEDMLREADLAMYRAKAEGKAHYAVFDAGMSATVIRRIELERNLRHAIENDEFEIYYQPLVSLETGRVVCLEALVRWMRPGVGLVPPLEFIPLAEEVGLILPIGGAVLRSACESLKEWRESTPESADVAVSVNLSARQFRHPGLTESVAKVLDETGVHPSDLKLEITESVVMSGSPETDVLADLRALGVGLMIDDFGTGHSSLAYLQRLPVEHLKIDRSFCSGLLVGDTVDEDIIAAVIRLGHATGLKVVAEGVETHEQLSTLASLGCDYAQGFLLSEPVPAPDVPDILRKRNLY